jgi:putative transcriptional regulator
MAVRNKLKDVRHDFRMNKGEFAEFLGINPAQYSRYENQRSQPSLEISLHISKKVNRTVNELFEVVSER